MKIFKFPLLILSIVIFTLGCGNEPNQNSNTPTTDKLTTTTSTESDEDQAEKKTEVAESKPLQEKNIIYAWVDKLNIRYSPDLKGKEITEVQSDDALEFTGERSRKREEIVLRGVTYDEFWLKVIAPNKKEGWVFGGAVKRKDEKKGNAPVTNEKFDFPHFGSFDLSTWKNLGTKTEGEEVDYSITTYQKGSQILEHTSSDMGEYSYGHSYKLMNTQKKILKTRSFNFSADVDARILTETVSDFTTSPAKEFKRTQNLRKHFYGLNAKPVMVNGTWNSKVIEE